MTSIFTYDHSLGPLSAKNQYGGLKNKILLIYPINVHLMTVLWFQMMWFGFLWLNYVFQWIYEYYKK